MLIMEETQNKHKADIRIIGVGGGGSNALEVMIKEGIQGVQFIAVNTDDQALEASSAKTKIQLGSKLTKGLGAGANPEVGRRAAVESYEKIIKILDGADMAFVTAGMGGGTGTGGAPLMAQAAKELGILTVGIVTTPFLFEGKKRMKQAQQGIQELGKHVDTLIVIPNEKLLQLSEKDTPLFETFKITDNVLLQAVKGIAELVSVPGLINLDFADIKTVMINKGMALMGRGLAEGSERAKKAVFEAISSPLLEGISIEGATGMIVNITAGPSLSLIEVQEASSILTKEADDSADIIVGAVINENMGDKISVTVIATGFPNREGKIPTENKKPDIETDLTEKIIEQKRELEEKERQNTSKTLTYNRKNEPDKRDKTSGFQQNKAIFLDSEESDKTPTPNPENVSQTDQEKQDTEKEVEKTEKKLSPKEKLLLKVKEYAQNQREKSKASVEENQMIMDWKKDSLEESLSSPFESSVDFSEKDMI